MFSKSQWIAGGNKVRRSSVLLVDYTKLASRGSRGQPALPLGLVGAPSNCTVVLCRNVIWSCNAVITLSESVYVCVCVCVYYSSWFQIEKTGLFSGIRTPWHPPLPATTGCCQLSLQVETGSLLLFLWAPNRAARPECRVFCFILEFVVKATYIWIPIALWASYHTPLSLSFLIY